MKRKMSPAVWQYHPPIITLAAATTLAIGWCYNWETIMKLVSIEFEGSDRLAILVNKNVYPLFQLHPSFPRTMAEFLDAGEEAMDMARKYEENIKRDPGKYNSYPIKEQKVLAAVPHPTSCRDGYAFRQHVAAARRNRGVPMIPEFDEYPIFYFTNHNAIYGPGPIELMPDHFQKLDFELEAAIVIGKRGRNIKAEEADQYIAGYMIMNDLSARTLQMEEMLLNLGPAKGKDFATSLSACLITPDELEPYRVNPKEGHVGNAYNLKMKAYVNDKQVSEGNLADMDWTFAEIIERVSYGVDIFPGDVIGSGTVGTGCFLELNGTGLLNDKNYKPQWLQDGDEVVMEIEHLGKLSNTMVKADTDYSILNLKKKAPIAN
jgi:fumarylacetoacetate (FAA) hydrolase